MDKKAILWRHKRDHQEKPREEIYSLIALNENM